MNRYIVADTETSGTGDGTGVCELAWQELDEDLNVIDRVYSLIDPQCPIKASASGIHGITNLDVEDAPTLAEFFEHFVPGKKLTGDIVFIAHNAPFDLPFFKPYIERLVATLCTLRLARKVFPSAENHKLSTLMYALDLPRSTSHRADGDVETTVHLLRRIVEETGATLEALAEEAARPIWQAKMPFGKHKDLPIESVPKDYIAWLLRQPGGVDPDLKWTLERVARGEGPA